MRNAFADTLTDLAARDERIVLLTGDIGNRLFDPFKAQHEDRFYNCGIAEANMVSMAAGMAMCGLRPVAYTIAPFITARCLEQIRVDLCYHDQPVVLVGVGAGLSYAELGATHESCEDIAMLRVLPNMTVICPADAPELVAALSAVLAHAGPVYLRLGKKGEPAVHHAPPSFRIGRGIVLRPGRTACLIGTGTVLPLVIEAADLLESGGVSTQVVSMPTVKPLDEALLRECFGRFRIVATIEEHSALGGLGGSVAEWMSDHPNELAHLVRIGTADRFLHEAGKQFHARGRLGLTADRIAQRVLERLRCACGPRLLVATSSPACQLERNQSDSETAGVLVP